MGRSAKCGWDSIAVGERTALGRSPTAETGRLDCYSCPETPLPQGRLRSARRAGCAEFFHRDAIAAVVVLDARHVGLDERQATAAAAIQVFFGGAVGHHVGAKARALVLDAHPEPVRAGLAFDDDTLLGVEPVAVSHRVYERFDERHLDGEQVPIGPAEQLELGEHFAHTGLMRPVLAGQGRVDGPAPRMFRHAVDFPPSGNLRDDKHSQRAKAPTHDDRRSQHGECVGLIILDLKQLREFRNREDFVNFGADVRENELGRMLFDPLVEADQFAQRGTR